MLKEKLTGLESVALKYLKYRVKNKNFLDETVHYPHTISTLEFEKKLFILRAFLAGAISALVSFVVHYINLPYYIGGIPWEGTNLIYWSRLLFFTALATSIEILFLYWDSLKTVELIAKKYSLNLFEADNSKSTIARILIRAALEIPISDYSKQIFKNSKSVKAVLVLSGVMYKAKIGFTNIVVKLILARFVSKFIARTWLEFIAIPITGIWNAYVANKVFNEIRVRSAAPLQIDRFVELNKDRMEVLSEEAKIFIYIFLFDLIKSSKKLHPNTVKWLDTLESIFKLEIDYDIIKTAKRQNFSELTFINPETLKLLLLFSVCVEGRFNKVYINILQSYLQEIGVNQISRPKIRLILRKFNLNKRISNLDLINTCH